jgi:hypothetical protein
MRDFNEWKLRKLQLELKHKGSDLLINNMRYIFDLNLSKKALPLYKYCFVPHNLTASIHVFCSRTHLQYYLLFTTAI